MNDDKRMRILNDIMFEDVRERIIEYILEDQKSGYILEEGENRLKLEIFPRIYDGGEEAVYGSVDGKHQVWVYADKVGSDKVGSAPGGPLSACVPSPTAIRIFSGSSTLYRSMMRTKFANTLSKKPMN
ncbi:MAG: hypothetical protein NC299_01745 [Lachnospiraceae bacterium]|nr:hypothetical protein [Ruminococcus sp.]MCM1274071.1 hypothetical protein [Lachnospiraceae bacterium]